MKNRQPSLVRYMLTHAGIGFCGGVGFGIMMIALNIGGLKLLIGESDAGAIGASLLCFCLGLTLGSLTCGAAVMRLGEADQRKPRGGRPILRMPVLLVPLRVRAALKR